MLVCDVRYDCNRRYRFATGEKLILFKHILLSSTLVNNRVIVIENKHKNFQLQLQQNRVINYNFVNYNFSKPDLKISFYMQFLVLIHYWLAAPHFVCFGDGTDPNTFLQISAYNFGISAATRPS